MPIPKPCSIVIGSVLRTSSMAASTALGRGNCQSFFELVEYKRLKLNVRNFRHPWPARTPVSGPGEWKLLVLAWDAAFSRIRSVEDVISTGVNRLHHR